MLCYDDMRLWVRRHDLVLNRVKVINVITEDRAKVGHRGCRWWVDFLDHRLCEWKAYDVRSVDDALLALDAVKTALWDCRRVGLASFAGE